jgi:hypothetical protein
MDLVNCNVTARLPPFPRVIVHQYSSSTFVFLRLNWRKDISDALLKF